MENLRTRDSSSTDVSTTRRENGTARRRRPSRRQAAALALTLAAGLVAGATALTSGGAAAGPAGPTAAAEVRDLAVTESLAGTLTRADSTTVVYDGTGGGPVAGPAGSGQVSAQGAGNAAPASLSPSATTAGRESTDGPASSTTVTPSTTTAPSTTTTAPVSPPPPSGTPGDGLSTETPVAEPRDPANQRGSSAPDGAAGDGGGTARPGGSAPDATPDDIDTTQPVAGTDRTATLTELAPSGTAVDRGSVLYRADSEPILALLAADPLLRDLRAGVTDGPDVEALETNMAELGYGTDLTVDEHFDATTTAAVESWEEDLGRAEPDGVVTVGEVVYLAEATTVLAHEAAVGDQLEPGDPVLVLGAQSRVVELSVAATDVGDWAVGTEVHLDWGEGTVGEGTVTDVSREVVDGLVEVIVTIGGGGGAERPIGSRLGVVRTVADRPGVLAVPASAIVSGHDGPSVRVVGDREDNLVPVEPGIAQDGWVEVTSGIEAGTEVRLPG